MSIITENSGYDQYLEFLHGQAGDFLKALFTCIQIADYHNLERLSLSFPSHVSAFKTWSRIGTKDFLTKVTPGHPLLKYYKST